LRASAAWQQRKIARRGRQGLRGPAQSLLSTDGKGSILRKIDRREIKKLAIITVNAKPGDSADWDKQKRAPGLLSVLSTVTSAPIDNYSFETIQSLNEKIDSEFVKPKQTERDIIRKLKETCPGVKWPELLPDLDFYDIELSFDRIKDPEIQKRLKELGTNYHLAAEDVELLTRAARGLLGESDTYRKLVKDLQ
jgi:NTE family protein